MNYESILYVYYVEIWKNYVYNSEVYNSEGELYAQNAKSQKND